MSRHANPPLPPTPFGLLLVEGGDELHLCEAVAGPTTWQDLVCWKASGRYHLPELARLAALDPNFSHARSIGLVLDMEEDAASAWELARRTLEVLGHTATLSHGTVDGNPRRVGIFLAPDGQRPGSIEHLCRQAVRNPELAKCVDALVACANTGHTLTALKDKAWLNAYLAMLPDPRQRFHQSLQGPSGGIDPGHAAFEPLRRFLRSL